jgi:hypothetical protein
MGLFDNARRLGDEGRRVWRERQLQGELDHAARELGFLVFRSRQGAEVEPERQQALFAEMVRVEGEIEKVRHLTDPD